MYCGKLLEEYWIQLWNECTGDKTSDAKKEITEGMIKSSSRTLPAITMTVRSFLFREVWREFALVIDENFFIVFKVL